MWVKVEFDELELKTRLNSSRGGSFYWYASKKALRLLNNAPYCPSINATLHDVTMLYGHTVKGEPLFSNKDQDLELSQREVEQPSMIGEWDLIQVNHPYKWAVKFKWAHDNTYRRLREKFFQALSKVSVEPLKFQRLIGNLEVSDTIVMASDKLVDLIAKHKEAIGPAELQMFNHRIVVKKYVPPNEQPFTVRLDNQVFLNAPNGFTIWSQNHPVTIYHPLYGYPVILRHPFPEKDRGTD